MSNFHTRGAVPLSSPAYVEREFENKVIQQINASNWVLLLGPRQHGKTSGLIRISAELTESGFLCAFVDLQKLPPLSTYEELLENFSREFARKLGVNVQEKPKDADVNQLICWLEKIIPPGKQPVVIIVDEASAISNDEWRNSFYGQIRAVKNEQASAQPEDLVSRLRFIFSGCFRPETLVKTVNSPFNVSEEVHTDDLNFESISKLYTQVTEMNDEKIITKIFNLVGGQPYLFQFICNTLNPAESNDANMFDDAIKSLYERGENHLDALFGQILACEDLADLVSNIVQSDSIPYDPANPSHKYLIILGLARFDKAKLVFRNELYRIFAKNSPQFAADPNAIENPSPLVTPLDTSLSFMNSDELREIAFEMESGAYQAYNAKKYRLALAGFGSALEAVLIDWLSNIDPPSLAAAVNKAKVSKNSRASFNTRYENENAPHTWSLANLIRVARHTTTLARIIDPPEGLREWRNQIHPSVAIQNYLPSNELEPEARTASGFLASIKRDLKTP